MANIKFSLYKLPNNAIIKVVGTMDTVSIVALSFISTRSKSLIKSLNLKDVKFALGIPGFVTVSMESIECPSFFLEREDTYFATASPIRLEEIPIFINTMFIEMLGEDQIETNVKWKNSGKLNYRQFFEHFQSIFHFDESLEISFFAGIQEIGEIEKLKEILPKFTELQIGSESSDCTRKIMKEFLSAAKSLTTTLDVFYSQNRNPVSLQKCGIHNLDEISIMNVKDLKLEDMLTLNARQIEFYVRREPHGSLGNRFIKSWIRGSNPRMDFIFIRFQYDPAFKADSILKGIQYKVVPENQEVYTVERYALPVKGGFEIRSRNGRRANVQIYSDDPFSEISIYVFV